MMTTCNRSRFEGKRFDITNIDWSMDVYSGVRFIEPGENGDIIIDYYNTIS